MTQPTQDQLLQALQNAHNQGDTEAAKQFAQWHQELYAPQPEPKPGLGERIRGVFSREPQPEQPDSIAGRPPEPQQQSRSQLADELNQGTVQVPGMRGGQRIDVSAPERQAEFDAVTGPATREMPQHLEPEQQQRMLGDINARIESLPRPSEEMAADIQRRRADLESEYARLAEARLMIENGQGTQEQVDEYNQRIELAQQKADAINADIQSFSAQIDDFNRRVDSLAREYEQIAGIRPPTDSFITATGKALSNVPGRFQQAYAGLVQLVGEDMQSHQRARREDTSRHLGITPEEYDLLAWAGNNDLVPRDMPIPEALDYIKQNIAAELDDQQIAQLAQMGVINPAEITEYALNIREQAEQGMSIPNAEYGTPGYYASAAIGSIAEMAPALLAGALTRNPQVTISIIGTQVAGQQYAEGRERGLSEQDARNYALASAAAEAIPEYVPVSLLLRPGASIWRRMADVAVAESLREVTTEALMMGIDNGFFDDTVTWAEARRRLIDAGILGGLAGTLMTGVTTPVMNAQDAIMERINTPERQIGAQLLQDVAQAEFQRTPESIARDILSPDRAQVQAVNRKSMAELVQEKMQQLQRSEQNVQGQYTQQAQAPQVDPGRISVEQAGTREEQQSTPEQAQPAPQVEQVTEDGLFTPERLREINELYEQTRQQLAEQGQVTDGRLEQRIEQIDRMMGEDAVLFGQGNESTEAIGQRWTNLQPGDIVRRKNIGSRAEPFTELGRFVEFTDSSQRTAVFEDAQGNRQQVREDDVTGPGHAINRSLAQAEQRRQQQESQEQQSADWSDLSQEQRKVAREVTKRIDNTLQEPAGSDNRISKTQAAERAIERADLPQSVKEEMRQRLNADPFESVQEPPEWRGDLMRTRQYAQRLMDAGVNLQADPRLNEAWRNAEALGQVIDDARAEVRQDESSELEASGQEPLAGVPAETVQGVEEAGQTGRSVDAGSRSDVPGAESPGESGVQPGGSVAGREGESPVSSTGERGTGQRQPGREAGERSERPTQPDDAAERAGRGNRDRVAAEEKAAESTPRQPTNQASGPSGDRPARMFTITAETGIGEGGPKTKFKNNLEAIRVLKQLREDGRQATPAEQKVLARYVGWGGLPQAFDSKNKNWSKEVEQLRELLTEDEYNAARRSTQDAHYTSFEIVDSIWQAVKQFGFTGGKVLEPSVGTGNFIGIMPGSIRSKSSIVGVELDNITDGIAQALYPAANINAPMGFQDFNTPDNYFDLVIGNPPFGNQRLYDGKRKDLSKFSIHNYFFAKSLDSVKPNGVLAMVVSNYLMDGNSNKAAREWLSNRADLLGAIRLPNNAFLKNAGTEVTTDIIFLRKRGEGEPNRGRSWTKVRTVKDKNGKEVQLNEYFDSNPDAMLGEFGAFGSMYGPDTAALIARDGQDTNALLRERIAQLPKNFMDAQTATPAVEDVQQTTNIDGVKVGSMYVADGEIRVRLEDSMGKPQSEAVEFKSEKAKQRVMGMIQVRDDFTALRKAQLTEGVKDAALDVLRAKLNKTYDAFYRKHGPINHDTNKRLFRDDPSYPQIAALENNYDKGVTPAMAKKTGEKARKPSAEKAAIFTKRTQSPYKPPESASSAQDALTATLSERGTVDMEYMTQLYGKTPSAIMAELGDLLYQAPDGSYQTRDQYLSGNVRQKLAEAERAAKDNPAFNRNVEALREVQPTDIQAVDIDIKPGAGWIPVDVMVDFANELLGSSNMQAMYNPINANWRFQGTASAAAMSEFGTNRVSAVDVIQAAANQKQLIVRDRVDDKTTVVNEAATTAANEKVERAKSAFRQWVWKDDARRNKLTRLYNDTYNTDRQRNYDGSHLKFPGKVGDDIIRLRPHQANAVWRILQSPTTLLDHVVGAGKTFTMIAGAMEMRRTGRAKKPMFVVPNHLVGQWAEDFTKLYPGANVLQTTKKDFEKNNRKRLMARIATGDWDAVIIAHSQFGKIEMDAQFQAEFIKEQIADIEVAMENIRQEQGKKDLSIKQIEKQKERLEEKLERLFDAEGKDDNLTFGEMGVDALFVDEAHEFKNLAFSTSMTRVAGLGNPQGSQKAQDMFMKTQYIKRMTGGNIVFATGTPISNTMAEMFTMQRYLDYDTLKAQGIAHFDAWARMYGEVVSDWELSPSGTYRLNSRFSKFVNIPEMMQRYLSFGDVINRDDINRQLAAQGRTLPVPKVKGGKPRNIVVDRSDDQAQYIGVPETVDGREVYPEGSLVWRSENLPKKPEKGADNMLKIMSDARKAALDMRLIDPQYGDSPNSKVNRAADEVVRIHKATAADRGTQLIFIDLSTPKGAKAQEAARIRDLMERAEQGDEAAQSQLDKMSPDDFAALDGDFSVYDDLRQKLINRGIPESEIAFIHDANTELQKEELFGKVRSGRVRVLFGSTAKMGAGMNVQERLVGLHHLDAPWRPSDLEQREGRIIRQGNRLYEADPQNFEVEILRYATKNTLDSRMWQTIETKARFIDQVRKGNAQDRTIEDIGGEASNAAEMKAASSGNPLILREMELRQQIRKLESLEQEHNREQFSIRDKINQLTRFEGSAKEQLARLVQDEKNKIPDPFAMTVKGKAFDKPSKAGEAIMAEAQRMADAGTETTTVGKYAGFDLILENLDGVQFVLTIKGKGEYQVDIKNVRETDATGLVRRVMNTVAKLPEQSIELAQKIKQAQKDIPKLQKQIKDFAQQKELAKAKSEYALVINELRPQQDTTQDPEAQILNSMGVDSPMPMWAPMYQTKGVPPRPENDRFELDGKTVKLNAEENPTRREGIRQWVEGIIGPRLYRGKIRGKARLGFYKRNNGEVRVKNFDDVEVMAHEMAHWLDFHHSNKKVFNRLYKDKRYRDEVEALSYTSDKKLRASEGFAEYVRLWLTQYSEAKSRAPLFTEAFNQVLQGQPRLNKQMRKLREEMHKWYMQGPRAQLRAKSGKDLSSREQIIEFMNRRPSEMMRQKALDRIHGAKVVERTLNGELDDATRSAYKLFQMMNGAESMHEAVMRDGTPRLKEDGTYEFSGIGLNEVFKPVARHGWPRFDLLMDYFKARRAQELMKQGRERLFTKQEIEAGLRLGQQYPDFPKVFNEFQAFNQRMLEFYEQMGLITPDQRKAFMDMNKSYVPFHRVIERIEDGASGSGNSIQRRLSGGTQNVRDIAANIVEGVQHNIRAALEARAKRQLYTDIMNHEDGALFAVPLAPDSRLVKVEMQQMAARVAEAMADVGITISKDGMIMNDGGDQVVDVDDVRAALENNPEAMMFWTHGHKPNTVETFVDSVIIDGQRKWFEVRDPLLVDMFTGMKGLKSNAILNTMFRVKNLQTRTITSMLQFLGPNAIRDTVSATLLSRNRFIPIYSTLVGMGHFVFNTKTYKEFRLHGGAFGTRIEARTEEMRSRRQLDLPSRNMWDRAAKFLAGWDRFASAFEYGSRVGDFSSAKRKNKNSLEAAWEAREVSTDYSKMGSNEMWAKFLRTVPFMNAGLQGVDRSTREIFEIKGEMKGKNLVKLHDQKTKFLLKGSVLTLGTVLLWLLNEDNEYYQGLTPDQRARFWWVFIPGVENPVKIPRPYDIGHIFATIPEIMLDYIKRRDGKEAAQAMAWTVANTLGIGDYPGIMQPFIEVARNEKFTGAPVVPFNLVDLPPEYQYLDRTPIMYRKLGEALGVSPLVAEHYTKGFLRYVEAYVADASEAYLWNYEEWGERPYADHTPIDYLTYQFRGQRVPYRTKWTEGYYDLRKRAAGAEGALRVVQQEAIRDSAPLEKFAMDRTNQTLMGLNRTFRQIDQAFSDQTQVIASIKYNPNLSRDEKERRIEAYYEQKNRTLRQFYEQAREMIEQVERDIGR